MPTCCRHPHRPHPTLPRALPLTLFLVAAPLCFCRLQHAALVCRRFLRLCCEPEFLSPLTVRISGGGRALPRGRSLLSWVLCHGAAVEGLDILMCPDDDFSPAERGEFAALTAACLTAFACLAAQLKRLVVWNWTPFATTAWLAAMRGLTTVDMGSSSGPVQLPDGLAGLSQLTNAYLTGQPLRLPPALPQSITGLLLSDSSSAVMPPQASTEVLDCAQQACPAANGSWEVVGSPCTTTAG